MWLTLTAITLILLGALICWVASEITFKQGAPIAAVIGGAHFVGGFVLLATDLVLRIYAL